MKLGNLSIIDPYAVGALLTDSQDVQELLESVGVPVEYQDDITGAYVKIDNGDYLAVWLCEDRNPYMIYAEYQPLPYYKNDRLARAQNLPDYWADDNPEYE